MVKKVYDTVKFINDCCYIPPLRSPSKVFLFKEKQKQHFWFWLFVKHKQLLWGIIILFEIITTARCVSGPFYNQILHLNFSRPPWAWRDRWLHARLHPEIKSFLGPDSMITTNHTTSGSLFAIQLLQCVLNEISSDAKYRDCPFPKEKAPISRLFKQ